MKHILFIVFLLTCLAGFSQSDELEIRKKTLGRIIEAPESSEARKLSDAYCKYVDSLYQSEGYPMWHCNHNCLRVLVLEDSITIDWQRIHKDSLRHMVTEFLSNPTGSTSLSDSFLIHLDDGSEFYMSKGVVIFQYNAELTQVTEQALREVAKGINDYRETLAFQLRHTHFNQLQSEDQILLKNRILNVLLIENEYLPPPPPPFTDTLSSVIDIITE